VITLNICVQLRRAMNTFKHQTVFNAESLRLQPLTPISNCLTLNYDARNGRKREEGQFYVIVDLHWYIYVCCHVAYITNSITFVQMQTVNIWVLYLKRKMLLSVRC
jgi:hypothetical protein